MIGGIDVDWGWTSAVIAILVFLWGILKGVLSVRDAVRDTLNKLTEALGKEDPYPGTGLIGRVTRIEERQDEHRDWFIAAGIAPFGTPTRAQRRSWEDRRRREDEDDGA